ncbi:MULTISPECIES: hypothetical protein [unclassified Pseudoalteromonas]|jgi:hypothetical protein|uniref:hypothetical protein n=1 Tax=unclassified Pseudoalteromonas TaxID=194690 RepID=UPI00235915B9|nr:MULTISPECIES: hypothetical protein [unclassified Pseudoalteromonas]MDC9502938.1 hypothetical protein [Pseudoalteromonas sp. Angola-18]MDC9530369.1 hypothetical protein [Pseudoalteromonas sp. Angola-7]
MTKTYHLFSISPPYRAVVFILLSIGLFWPLMMIHYFTGYHHQPPLDLAIPFFLFVCASLVRVKLTNNSITLNIFGINVYNFNAALITTRQEGRYHRVFFRENAQSNLKATLFLFNLIPVELMEYRND